MYRICASYTYAHMRFKGLREYFRKVLPTFARSFSSAANNEKVLPTFARCFSSAACNEKVLPTIERTFSSAQ